MNSNLYLREFVSEIRFDGKRVVMRGKKAALLAVAAQKEMGTARVPQFQTKWLLNLGSNQGFTDQQPGALSIYYGFDSCQ